MYTIIIMTKTCYKFCSPYKLLLLDDYYHNLIAEYYETFMKTYKPLNLSVTYLVWSGVSFPAFNIKKFPEDMTHSYALAFNTHQRPYKTYETHIKAIKYYTYYEYLWIVAFPVDVYAHTMQFFWGERDEFLEGGAFFIPYMTSHWILLSLTLLSPYVYSYFPEYTWIPYFSSIYYTLALHDYCYRMAVRNISLNQRLLEFIGFCYVCYGCYQIISNHTLVVL